MNLRNKIFNYFVSPSIDNGMPIVVLCPITINAKDAKILIKKQFKREHKADLGNVNLLHVCFDFDSGMIYLPNAQLFTKEVKNLLLSAVKLRIIKDFGNFSFRSPIEGSPFSSLRIRSLSSFIQAKKMIDECFKDKIIKDIPVIEAYLPSMPTTLKCLPENFRNKDYTGGLVDSSGSVTFLNEYDFNGKKLSKPVVLLTQPTPFILINIAQTKTRKEPSATDREWVVINGYRDYLYNISANLEKDEKYDINASADLFSIKRFLYLGWSFEELSSYMLREVDNIVKLMAGIDRLMFAANDLAENGYSNPASIPYYMSFKIDKTFPISIHSITNKLTGKIDVKMQNPNLTVVDYDFETSFVIIKTPAFISPSVCIKSLNAKSNPFIVKYNPTVNTIDVKSDNKSVTNMGKNKLQMFKICELIGPKDGLKFRKGELASGISSTNPNVYNIRKVSEFFYASDRIKKACKEYELPFVDFDIVIGPIERALGRGIRGGYMDANLFRLNKMEIPTEIAKGVWIKPPVIFINSIDNPSYADQAETLLHEYVHYLFGLKNPNYTPTYSSKNNKSHDFEYWNKYFNDPSEIVAHKHQIKLELEVGKSYDEIIRNKVGGSISLDNYPIANKFSSLVNVAMNELEKEGELI
jgi:hypothetical protein